jgi:hypothetical protein
LKSKAGRADRAPGFLMRDAVAVLFGLGGAGEKSRSINEIKNKKRGAAGITTAAPRIAGQWGRGDNRLSR